MTINDASQMQARPARPAAGALGRESIFIDGEWRAARGDARLEVTDSGSEEILGTVRAASSDDVDAAVVAAEAAISSWAAAGPQQRASYLRDFHRELVKRAADLTSVISAEVGTVVRMCLPIQVRSSFDLLELVADAVSEMPFEEQVRNSLVVHREVGVVAAITPWNYPLFQTMGKVAAALAAGCTVVHKPAELAPFSAFIMAEAAEAAGLPHGVYNLVTGRGPDVGECLVSHPLVRMVSFTGSTATGARVYQLAAASIKRVALELGGKSPSIVLDDADLPTAVKATMNRAFLNSGQTCDAWTRLLVPREQLDDALELAKGSARRLTLGDPFDEAARLGPLVSDAQRAKVQAYIDGAVADGASLVLGGSAQPDGFAKGYYVQATVLADVRPDMRVAREEVFGPVLVVLPYDSEDDAISIANDSEYGLSAAVWSGDDERAFALASRVEAGQVVINGGTFNPAAPFGGVKHSGVGRELGVFGIQEFLETRAYQR
jgi:aldehyde dehydrogenase (NAD+)